MFVFDPVVSEWYEFLILYDSIDFPNVGSTKPLFYTIKWWYTNQSGYSKGDSFAIWISMGYYPPGN